SQEEGTPAGVMANQVPEEVKQERWQRLMERQARVVRRKNLALIGSEPEVLGCGPDAQGRLWGRTHGQAPAIDGVVFLNHIHAESGEIIPARITGVSGYDLRAKGIAPITQRVQPIDIGRVPL